MNSCHKHHFEHHHLNNVQETCKIAEVKDKFGHTMFKVALTDFEDNSPLRDDLSVRDTVFQVTVWSYCQGDTELIVTDRKFVEYDTAIRFFHDMTERYSKLANATSRDIQDIRQYASDIGYHQIDLQCCATCKWAQPCCKENCLFDDWRAGLRGKYICTNSAIYDRQPECNDGAINHPCNDIGHDATWRWHDKRHEHPHNHHMHCPPVVLQIEPIVDGLCVCEKGYERRNKDN